MVLNSSRIIFSKSTAQLDALNSFCYKVFCSLIIGAIKQSLDRNKWSVMTTARQNWIITYRGIPAQPTTNWLNQVPLGMLLKKNLYLDLFFVFWIYSI